jgi:hypothetical protein
MESYIGFFSSGGKEKMRLHSEKLKTVYGDLSCVLLV